MRSLIAALALLCPLVLLAADIHVAPDGSGDIPTIQAAIDAAVEGDRIVLADGTYRGDGNRDLTFRGKAIVVMSGSGDPFHCVIDCEGTEAEPHRGFVFRDGETRASEVRDIAIVNGREGFGAGMSFYYSDATIRGCVFAGCRGLAAISTESIEGPLIIDCLLVGNDAGGLSVDGGHCEVSNTTIAGNLRSSGGGIVVGGSPASLAVSESIVWGNCATGEGDEIKLGAYAGLVTFDCSILNEDGVDAEYGRLELTHTISEDPQFCDPLPCEAVPIIGGDYDDG